jgi:hypothetical protein
MRNKLSAAWRAPVGKVLIFLALGLLISEVLLRSVEKRLSGNLQHIGEIPSLMDEAEASGRPALVVLGNSLVNNGIAAEPLGSLYPAGTVIKITPDGTRFWDWQCLIRHQILERRNLKVDTLMLGYAWHLLSDQTKVDPSSLGALFCRPGDVLNADEIGLGSVGDMSEFLVASSLRPYALRETLRNRGLALLIPNYQRFTQLANVNREAARQEGPKQPVFTYRRFTQLAEDLHAHGIRLVIIAMPVRGGYELDEELLALAARGLIVHLDYRAAPGIDASSFKDAMHLTEAGQGVLTSRLVDDLSSPQVALK